MEGNVFPYKYEQTPLREHHDKQAPQQKSIHERFLDLRFRKYCHPAQRESNHHSPEERYGWDDMEERQAGGFPSLNIALLEITTVCPPVIS